MNRRMILALAGLCAAILLNACSLFGSPSATPQVDIDATVDARVAALSTELRADIATQVAADLRAQNAPTATAVPPTVTPPPAEEATAEESTAEETTSGAESAATPTPEPAGPVADAVPEEPYDQAGMEVLATLNAWRLSQNLLPYAVNQTLTDLAQEHLDYIRSLPEIPDDIHRGASGEYPKQRAAAAGWPTYNVPQQILVDEIAYVGPNAGKALDWWLGSTIHSATLHNPGYREIGVAVADHQYGHFYMIVFGSRPDVLPTLYDPSDGIVFLSAELHSYAAGGSFMMQPTTYQLAENAQSTASPEAWQPWVTRVRVPADLGSLFDVLYTDGIHQVRFTVDENATIVWLPTNITDGE